MTCDAKIEMMPGAHISCEKTHTDWHDEEHKGVLRDYAYEGSSTVIVWFDDDRRCYYGEYPGPCTATLACSLPNGHDRNCVVD